MKPTLRRAPRRELGFGECRDVDAARRESRRRRLVDAGDEVEQRRLARSRRPHQRDVVAGGDVEVDVDEHRDDLVAAPVRFHQIPDLYYGFSSGSDLCARRT